MSDVDGVRTDSGVYYSARGEELERLSMRDGMGVGLLRYGVDDVRAESAGRRARAEA